MDEELTESEQRIVDAVCANITSLLEDLGVYRVVSGPKQGDVFVESGGCNSGCGCDDGCGC